MTNRSLKTRPMKILITGATSGIGRQLVLDYLGEAHTVYCCGRNESKLESLRQQFPAQAIPLAFDVQDRTDCEAKLASLPALDLVILNAGTCEYMDAMNFDAALFERVMATNVQGVANCLQFLIPRLKEHGQLAMMGSSSSFLPLPRAEAYGASKAAIEYLSKTLAISLGPRRISVSYIAPGFVETPLTDANDFPMPMQVDVEYAARCIRKGLRKRRREIHFPWLFTGSLKLFAMLPMALKSRLLARLVRK